ncbi:MAG: phosphatase PAP2 family protein [Pollutimonas bauzanensis]
MNRNRYLLLHVIAPVAVFALLAWLAHRSALDFQIAAAVYDPATRHFPWRGHYWLEVLGHKAVLALPIGMAVAALAAVLASYRVDRLRPWRGALCAMLLTCLVGQVTIAQMQELTALPRPHELLRYGGERLLPEGFWASSLALAGGAMPSGHAGAGYSLLVLYFAGWARGIPALRWSGLAVGLLAGGLFSAVRMLQGMHFLSQTLASAAVMWALASLIFLPLICSRKQRLPGSLDAALGLR